MVFETLKTQQVNVPLIGGISVAGLLLAGGLIFFLTRRKKSINLKI